MKPSIGRIVHYVLTQRESPNNAGATRPAIITSVRGNGECCLTVFTDPHHDQSSHVVYVKSAPMHDGEAVKHGTWKWPPKIEHAEKAHKKHEEPTSPFPIEDNK